MSDQAKLLLRLIAAVAELAEDAAYREYDYMPTDWQIAHLKEIVGKMELAR